MKSSVITRTEDRRYVFLPMDTNQPELVPMDKIHQCLFPSELLDAQGLIKDATVLDTVRMNNGWIYPNHSVYPPLGDKLRIPASESCPVEFKLSFKHCAGEIRKTPVELREKTQLQELAATLSGFSNAKIKGVCYVGVNDEGEVVPSLEEEFDGKTHEEFELDFRNRLAATLNSSSFASKYLLFQWQKQKGRLYCKISVTPFHRILFVSGRFLYIRSDSAATVSLLDQDIVDFCKHWS